MSCQDSANLASTPVTKMSNENRNLANFIPNVWGNIFLAHPSEMNMDASEHEKLKQEVRRMLATSADKPSQKLHLIDAVQRLGVAYHFEKDIRELLQNIYEDGCNDHGSTDDLYTASIRFRLLREHGFNVPCDLFNKFKDEKGDFKESLTSDVRGLLELYEAAYLGLHGEDILEEAIAFTTSHLKKAESMAAYPLSTQIANALKRPLLKSLPRLVARSYISIYEGYGSQDETLMKFAKVDFNILQHLHRKEMSELNRWWKGIDVPTNFPFSRDRLIECYMWILGLYFEPHYTFARMFTTKVTAMLTILDDIYDAYGTHDELDIFTEAFQRWDINGLDQLPDYMKLFCTELFNVYKELEETMIEPGRLYRVPIAKEAWKRQTQYYHAENKWLQKNQTPTLEEYMSASTKSTGYELMTITLFVGMEDTITEDTFIWTFNDPKILRASYIICRLMDDVVSYKFEKERRHIDSAIECYVRECGASEEEACREFNKQIENAWKDINEELLKLTAVVPEQALTLILNLSRVMDLFYKDEDAFTNVGEAVTTSTTALLIDPISI